MTKKVMNLLIRSPDGERISKAKVAGIFAALIALVTVPIAIKAGKGNQEFQQKQKARQDESRQNATDTSMSEYNNGNKNLQQYVAQQTEKKNNQNRANYINGMNVPITGNGSNGQFVPGFAPKESGASQYNYAYSERPPIQAANSGNNSDPIYQELQQEKVDKLKHKYASYRADTLMVPGIAQGSQSQQQNNTDKPQADSGQVSNSSNNTTQAIPQPTRLASNGVPSDGYAHPSGQQDSDQNQQAEKNNYLATTGKKSFPDDVNSSEVQDPASKFMISAGTPICIYLLTPINSDLPGVIVGRTCNNVYDTKTGNQLLMPKGSKIIGNYDSNIVFGQNRVMAVWNRVIFPDTTSYRLNGMPGTDAMGVSGLTGEVNNHLMKIYGGALAMSFITAGMQYSQNNTNPNVQVGGLGVTTANPTMGQTLAGSLGQQMGQAGMQVTQKNLNVQPTIEIPAGEEVRVILTSDVVLRPFNRKEYAGNSILVQNGGN